MKKLRIGNSSGFWGDEPLAMDRQIRSGNLDYLTADYLAEVSMSILAKQQAKNKEYGYVTDFIEHIRLSHESLKSHFPRIITNAGGNNPIACARALQKWLSDRGFHKKVMAITGDNLMGRIEDLMNKGNAFDNLETGASFEEIAGQLKTANAYTSAEGIEKALELGADIVICGRASDSALAIGPAKFEFGWGAEEFNQLASAMVAGHLIECGAQSTGGNFTDWKGVKQWHEMGYPIVEMASDGDFILTKAPSTGGLVSQWTVKEQLVYEIGDPENYLGPDVTADLTTLKISEDGPDRISVTDVTGKPSPAEWKVSMAYHDGYRASGMIVVGGEKAQKKAEILEQILWKRLPEFKKRNTNFIGSNALGDILSNQDPTEVLLQFTAFDDDRGKLEIFSKEVAGLILSGPQGVAAFGGRPRIQEVIAYWPTLVKKDHVVLEVHEVHEDGQVSKLATIQPKVTDFPVNVEKEAITYSSTSYHDEDLQEVQLNKLCLARSGDKGNSINLGVIARSEVIYDFLRDYLTSEVLKDWFSDICQGEIRRFEMQNLLALNFVLNEALDGGGTRSGRLDPQGKLLASAFLLKKIRVPQEVVSQLKE